MGHSRLMRRRIASMTDPLATQERNAIPLPCGRRNAAVGDREIADCDSRWPTWYHCCPLAHPMSGRGLYRSTI